MRLNLRAWINLLPQEPPPFLELVLHRILRSGYYRYPLRRTVGYVPRGINWVLTKHELPFEVLTEIQQKAYPQPGFDMVNELTKLRRTFDDPMWTDVFSDRAYILGRDGDKSQRLAELAQQLQETPELLRIADWTAALMLAFDTEAIERRIPRYEMSSFGVDWSGTLGGPRVFGVFVYTDEGRPSSIELRPLKIAEHEFPVTVKYGQWLEDSNAESVHPVHGTAACWAVSNRIPIRHQVGFLTAAHIINSPFIGKTVKTHSGNGQVLDLAPDADQLYGIDAMLVRFPNAPSEKSLKTNHKGITNLRLIAPFIHVQFRGTKSGLIKTTIIQVTQFFGTLNHKFPAGVVLADCAKPGDSGALIEDESGRGVGLYTKRFRDMSGRENGLGMHLAQIADSMSLDLYRL